MATTTALRQLRPLVSLASRPDAQPRRHYRHSGKRLAAQLLSRRVAPAAMQATAGKTELWDFNKAFPDVVRELTEAGRHLDVPSATARFAKVLQYNMTGGKKNRGLALVLSYKLLMREQGLEPDQMHLANIMGWCLEMLHTSLLMTQDALDGAAQRRGKPCWFLTPELRSSPQAASSDATLLQTGLYQLLKAYFKSQPYYEDVVELFHDVSHKAMMGQVMDIETRSDKTLKHFNMERYAAITKYKTAYHTFQMPVSLALHMAGMRDVEIHRQAKTILMEMGQFYQVVADFVACYGDPSQIGRAGTDIEDRRCTWLAVVALQRCSKSQRKIMEENYGINDPQRVAKVKELYDELGIPITYKIYEEKTYDLLCTHIQQISRGLPHKLFFKFLEKIYQKEE